MYLYWELKYKSTTQLLLAAVLIIFIFKIVPMAYECFKGKTYIVTGAASGMGRAISIKLARQGANVGLVDLNNPDHVLAEIEQFGGKATSVSANVQHASEVDAAFKTVVEKFGRLDGAANMAGTVGSLKLGETKLAMEVLKDEDWDFLLATNLNGVKNAVRAELQLMSGSSSLVNAASVSGQLACPFNSPYGAGKFGVIGITKSVAQEVASKGIRINAVAP